jgi:hypothetical protein
MTTSSHQPPRHSPILAYWSLGPFFIVWVDLGPVWLGLFFLTAITSNVTAHAWSTKYRLFTKLIAQIESNLQDESIKLN